LGRSDSLFYLFPYIDSHCFNIGLETPCIGVSSFIKKHLCC